jgi:hypothetical protein
LIQLLNLSVLTVSAEACEVPEELGQLQKLRQLRLKLLDCGGDPLPKSLGALVGLQELEIERSEIIKIPETIGALVNLRELSLRQTSIREIPSSIDGCKELEILDCSDCHSLAAIPKEIGNLKKLRALRLNGSFAEIPIELSNLSSLEELELDGKFISLPMNLADLPSLKKLYIRGRFSKIEFSYFESSPLFDREKFRAQIPAFNSASKAALDAYAAATSWPIFVDSRDAQKRPLNGIPVYSSFKQAALPGEEIIIRPASAKHENAFKALVDGTPIVFLSEYESDTSLNGHLSVGVIVENGEDDYGTYKLKCGDRVSLTSVYLKDTILLADIDSYSDVSTEVEPLNAIEVKERLRPKLETHLKALRMPKGKLSKSLEAFDRGFGHALRNGSLSYFIASRLPTSYELRQELLLITNEKERLTLLGVV